MAHLSAAEMLSMTALPALETAVRDAGSGRAPWEARVGTAVLRLYLASPASASADVSALVLALSLAQPSAFSAAALMVADTTQPTVAAIIAAERLLSSGDFPAFWAATHAEPLATLLAAAPAVAPAVRAAIIAALARTYQRIPTAAAAAALSEVRGRGGDVCAWERVPVVRVPL